MEVIKEGIYWAIKNTRGPVPKELSGIWLSKDAATQAVEMLQARTRSRAVNPAQIKRDRETRRENRENTSATENSASTA